MSYEKANLFVNTSQPFLENSLMFPFLSVSQPTPHLKCNHYFTFILIISLLFFTFLSKYATLETIVLFFPF